MHWTYPEEYDVIVIGGGHAGCEAAHAAAKMGARTLLLTMNISTIAQMSCNPSVGGIGKGHIVREIDALGGLMGKITDKTFLQMRMLNTKKGPAVQAPRAQADKEAYKTAMRMYLEATENLFIKQATVTALSIEQGVIKGVLTKEGILYAGKMVILTSGTFMRGILHIGNINFSGGRAGDAPSLGLSNSLEEHGIKLGRLKTGTPVRVHKRSINFSEMEEQYGDDGVYFSFDQPPTERLEQRPCYITYTSQETKRIIQENVHLSAMYSGNISGVGPRYCPSIEDKVVRFHEKDRHQVFLEPESLISEEFYVNGVSSSLPFPVQYAFIRSIPGLENAEIMRPGYAIEYDFIESNQITFSLESRHIQNLFFAGQINGTTGYEEAAGQGLIAGINAVQKLHNKSPYVPTRAESYIGVMIDDLVTKGVDEPYRMFTSRAEYRLRLHHDNADLRLRKDGYTFGLINHEQYTLLQQKRASIDLTVQKMKKTHRQFQGKHASLAQFLARPDVQYNMLSKMFPEDLPDFRKDIQEQIERQIKYDGYVQRQEIEVKKLEHIEKIQIPQNLDYYQITGLRSEAKERLHKVRPNNLGQASRIRGIAPSDISVLMIALENRRFQTIGSCCLQEND